MKLYHGTNAEILQIDLNKSRVGKDFGLGFYLTPDKQIGYQIRRVEEGIISEEQFLEEIKFHSVTIQYMFSTEKSIKLLQRV